jgi:D-beta-D-heptose 7-phosphate kinase/D-beta-D-heptose 1-phosphate adenosyltransferase
MTLFEEGEDAVTIPAVTRQVFDVTGAGDTVITTLALSLAAGAGLSTAARLANYAAGLAVSKVGTAAIGSDELGKLLSEESGVRGEPFSRAAATTALAGSRGTVA